MPSYPHTGRGPPFSTGDQLVKILAEMVRSALDWEANRGDSTGTDLNISPIRLAPPGPLSVAPEQHLQESRGEDNHDESLFTTTIRPAAR